MIKILIVDDQEIIVKGLQQIIASESGLQIIGCCSNGEQALEFIQQAEQGEQAWPSIVTMDLNMPGLSGIGTIEKLNKQFPGLKILVVSHYSELPIPTQALAAGANGFMHKNDCGVELANAIRRIHSGQQYLSPTITKQVVKQRLPTGKKSPFILLSERETEIAKLLISGKNIDEIAIKLEIKNKTINSYRYRMFDKLNIKSDIELAKLALRYDFR